MSTALRHRASRARAEHRRGAATALALALATALAVSSTPARGDSLPDPAVGDAQHRAQNPPDEAAELAAIAKAQSTGAPVVIDSLTTPWAQTVANPDGSLSTSSSADPVRAHIAGTWQPISTALRPTGDGRYSPAATVDPLILSGGGSSQLAVLTSTDGKRLTITAPFTLPAPAVSGATADYAGVLPDVDLRVTAEATGGIREVLVINNASAASNPALKELRFTTSGAGLTLATDAQGTLTAQEAAGQMAFVSPAATMWDSSTTAPPVTANLMSRSAAAAPGDTTPAGSTADGPGPGAHVAGMATSVTGSTVTVTPDPTLLTGAGTHYPVYEDPDWLPWSAGSPISTWTQSLYPSTNNLTSSGRPAVGLCGDYPAGAGCSPSDTERSYFQFDTSAIHGAVIHSATLTLNEYDSADWSCTNTYPLSLYLANGIDAATTWNNPPAESSLGLTRYVGGSGSSNCYGNVPFSYDITSTMQKAADGGWTHTAFGVHGDESNDVAFKHLTRSGTLTLTYDRTPNTPTSPTTSPVPQNASAGTTQPCDATANPTAEAFVGLGGLDLEAHVSSPAQSQVRGYFDLWDDSAGGFPTVASGYTGYVSSGSQVTFHVDQSKFTDGHAYAWDAATSDGLLSSSYSSTCHLRVDLTPPTIAFSSSSDFPPAGSGQAPAKYVGQQGTFPITASDPSPSTGPASGMACLRWGFDPTLTSDAWQCGSNRTSIALTPTHWGTNIAYAQAMDNAGNQSQIASYAFYAPWNPAGPAPVFGDTTGDGSPDVLVPGTDGNLYAHSLPGNSQAGSPSTSLTALKADSPDGDSWADYQIAHRGSLRGGKNVDDLIVHHSGDANLYAYPNPGNTGTDGLFDHKTTMAKPGCVDDGSGTYCTGYVSDWSTTLTVAAVGDPGTSALNAGKFQDRTGLLTEEANASGDAALWFYPTISDNTLGHPIRLAATGWKGLDLIAPGDWNSSGRPGLWTRNRSSGQIEAYTFTTGTRTTDDYGNPLTTPVPTVTAISSGTVIHAAATGDPYTSAASPLIGSDGDLTGDSIPDLWSVDSTGTISVHNGTTNSAGNVNGISAVAQLAGYTTGTANTWPLTGTPADTSALNPAATTGSVTWPTDTTKNKTVAAFNGSTAYLRTPNDAVDTRASYTITVWVRLASLSTATQTAVSQSTNNHQAFYLGYDGPSKSWYYMTTTDDNATGTSFPCARGGIPDLGWHQLAAVHDAATHVMSLYVDGTLVGAADNTTPAYEGNGHFDIGGNLATNGSSPYNLWNGSISDVRAYPTALTAAQITETYTRS